MKGGGNPGFWHHWRGRGVARISRDAAPLGGVGPELRSQGARFWQNPRSGVVAGIMCGTPETAEHWRRIGFRMMAIDSDGSMLTKAAQADARRCRELAAETAATT